MAMADTDVDEAATRRGSAAVANAATGRSRGSSPPRTSSRKRLWGMSPRTRGGERKQDGRGIVASADKSWTAVGGVVSDEAARGEGKRGTAAADETTGRPMGDVASVDDTARTTV